MTAFAADNFSGVAASDLGGQSASDGGSWTAQDGTGGATGVLNTNVKTAGSSSGRCCYTHSATPPSADYQLQQAVHIDTTTRGSLGLAVRVVAGAGGNKYWCYWNGGAQGWQIHRRVGGSDLQIGTTQAVYAPTGTSIQVFSVQTVGGVPTFNMTVDGNTVFTNQTDGNASPILGAGLVGLMNYFADHAGESTTDDFSASPLASSFIARPNLRQIQAVNRAGTY